MQINGLRNLVVACAAGISSLAFAAPVPSDLLLVGQVSIDTGNSLSPIGDASQSGTIDGLSNGVASTASFSDVPSTISPSSLVSGTLLSIGDGFGANFTMSGSSSGNTALTDGLFADFSFSLNNSSATLTYTLIFQVSASNSVSATGLDAFAQSSISVKNSALDELFFSDFNVDTLNTGPSSNFQLASPTNTFAITLTPGQSSSFTALQKQRGGAYAAGSSYSASLATFVRLQDIRSSGGGGDNQVPTPGSLALLLAGVAALCLARRATRH